MDHLSAHLLHLPNNQAGISWPEKIELLYAQQLENWAMVANNYHQLQTIEKRTIEFDHFHIDIQFNPARARSTCADLSKKVIEQRPCFLCNENLPEEQKGYIIAEHYLLLINPFPIFDRHLTISDIRHQPQRIENRIINMLQLAKELNTYTIFYNGPRCGASAPDHFHFQAAPFGKMPIDNELILLNELQAKTVYQNNKIKIFTISNVLRQLIVLQSDDETQIDNYFQQINRQLPFDVDSGEPMMNILANYFDGRYRLLIFPRKASRPGCFYKNEQERIMVSPASVEMGGLMITPRKEDYKRIDKNQLVEIFKQVSGPLIEILLS